jgi:hypothetical protein
MSSAGELSGRRGIEPQRAFYVRDPLDFYIEDRACVDSLLAAETFPLPILDPCCGSGNIVRACQVRGWQAVGSDIAHRGFGIGGVNFLTDSMVIPAQSIICNPPYKVATDFAYRAFQFGLAKLALLVQLKFLASQGRYRLFDGFPPRAIHILSRRPSMPPGEKYLAGEVEAENGKMDFCWIVWERNHVGPTIASWCPPEPSKAGKTNGDG